MEDTAIHCTNTRTRIASTLLVSNAPFIARFPKTNAKPALQKASKFIAATNAIDDADEQTEQLMDSIDCDFSLDLILEDENGYRVLWVEP